MKSRSGTFIRFVSGGVFALLGAFILQSCDSDNSENESEDDSESVSRDELLWESCPKSYTGDNTGFLCTNMNMPLNHDRPDGEQIDVLVYKYDGEAEEKDGQIWLLMGGPGDSNVYFIDAIVAFAAAYPNWDYYSIEHRGVGASTPLSCPQVNEGVVTDFAGCAEHQRKTYGESLADFTTTQAAFDVGEAIDRVSRETQTVSTFIYGASYGTYWVQRYLQIFPQQVSGVVLDSIIPPGFCSFDTYDHDHDRIGRALLDVCTQDDTCLQKMSTISNSPLNAVATVFKSIDDATICSPLREIITRKSLRNTLGAMVRDWYNRIGIPPLIYRIARCNENDVIAVKYTVATILENLAADIAVELNSSILGMNIELSELLEETPPLESVIASTNALFFSIDQLQNDVKAATAGWPVYGNDGYMGHMAETDIPILMLQGDFDPQTPYEPALLTRDHFNGPYQYFFTFHQIPHAVMISSHTQDSLLKLLEDQNAFLPYTCGAHIFWSFLQNPYERPSGECLDSLYPIEFDGRSILNQTLAKLLFNTEDLWGDEGTR